MRPIVKATDLSVGHDGHSILENLNFEIFRGDFICLMGSNGRGKTTLLRTLTSLLPTIKGDILFNENSLESYSAVELSKLIAVVLTERLDLANITVWDFVAMGRAPYTNFWGTLKESDCRIIDNSLRALHFEKFKNCFFNELSDGQKQKVLIARALAQDTPILFLDEPTNFLDMPRKMELMVLLKRIAEKEKKAILFSSHDWELALEMNSQLWLIDDEGKFNVGMPEEIILRKKLFSSFVSEDVEFSTTKGRFEEVIAPTKFVRLIGENDCVKWTAHALRKNAIGVDEKSLITVCCNPDGWLVEGENGQKAFDNLFSLVWFDFDSF